MRLTRTGVAILIGSLAVVALGLALGVDLLTGMGVAGLVALTLAVITVLEPPRIDVTRNVWPPEVDRGSPAQVNLQFLGTTTRRPRAFTVIETVAGQRRVAALPKIGGGQVLSLPYDLDTSRRGKVVTGPLVLRRNDPMGLVVAERNVGSTASVSVRPRRHPIRMLPSGRLRDLEGPTREVSQGTASFHQLREYVPGDDLRHIHWRSTARTGTMVVKHLVDTTRPEVVVVVDNRQHAVSEDDFEGVVEVAASIVHAAETDGFPTLLLFADGSNEAGSDGLPVPHIERLTDVVRTEHDSMHEMAQSIRGRGRSLVFVTGELPAPELQLVGELSRRFSPAYLVSVVAERSAPFISPPGVVGVAVANAAEFAVEWATVR